MKFTPPGKHQKKIKEQVAPNWYVIGDVNRRRGRIMNQTANKGIVEVESEIPLGEMFGYSTQLRSITSGRGNYTMEPSHFERVPAKIQEEITKK